jgi:hypothetical protein
VEKNVRDLISRGVQHPTIKASRHAERYAEFTGGVLRRLPQQATADAPPKFDDHEAAVQNRGGVVRKRLATRADHRDPHAPAGADGQAVARLMRSSLSRGAEVLREVTGAAIRRHFREAGGPEGLLVSRTLFTEEERERLAGALAAARATAELLGRAHVRLRAQQASRPWEKPAVRFGEDDPDRFCMEGKNRGKPGPCPDESKANDIPDTNGRSQAKKDDTSAPARREVTFDYNEKAQAVAKAIFGRDVPHQELAAFMGAQPGAHLHIEADQYGKVSVHSTHPDYEHLMVFYRDARYGPVAHHATTRVYRTGGGLGTKIFAEGVKALEKAGVYRITATAKRDDKGGWNGHYTWPLMGYDGKIPDRLRTVLGGLTGGLPYKFRNARTLHELLTMPGGREWWKEHGTTVDVVFDTREGSQSRRVMDAYLAARAAKQKGENRGT